MKIGIGIPCKKSDIPFIESYALPSISRLDPPADEIYIYVNNVGYKGLGQVRMHIFDILFNRNCDVVLQCSVDYILFKDILAHVSAKRSTGFGYIFSTPIATLVALIRRYIVSFPWTGCYAITKKDWERIRIPNIRDGKDWRVKKNIIHARSVLWPKYMLRRRNLKKRVDVVMNHPENRDLTMISKILRIMDGMPL